VSEDADSGDLAELLERLADLSPERRAKIVAALNDLTKND